MSISTTAQRSVAGSAALALLGSAFAVVAATAPAQAVAAPSFDWQISQQFKDHLSTRTLGDGASESGGGAVTFPAGVGSYNPTNGAATVSYQGSVKGAFVNNGTEYYSVTLKDPTVVVEGDGKGSVSAVVSATNAAAMGNPASSTTPQRVVVTTFAAVDGWAGEALTATPNWAGVLPAGSPEATALNIPADKPIDGKAFAPSFLAQLTPGLRSHFYASGSASDVKKAPAALTATANPISTTATVTKASYTEGLSIAVTGSGFSAVTNPGDQGIYVGLAPSGGRPDVSSQTGMEAFVAADWLPGARISAGALTSTLIAEAAKLDPTRNYSVYTWRAHTHSTVSQDTETQVAIDWVALTMPTTPTTPTTTAPTKPATPTAAPTTVPVAPTSAATKTNAQVTKKPTTERAGKLVAKVGGAGAINGKAKVIVKAIKAGKKGPKKIKRTVVVKNGKAVVKVPKLAVGRYQVTVRFLGGSDLAASTSVTRFRVKG